MYNVYGQVSSLALHPEFHPRTVAHSVAVLFLETEFQLAQHIDTVGTTCDLITMVIMLKVCRPGPTQVFHNNTDCYVKGWGRDKYSAAPHYCHYSSSAGSGPRPSTRRC